ncbi:MAG: LysR substrate-binding domain-containing protein [Planctomycetes bacterium]|nr:LysR substrate-binding domain-containing protein [Planctomycetota bacterium]
MELDQLRGFVAASEEGSISRAAVRLHVTQPALSRQIGRLERELGVDLFARVKRRIHLTEAGRFFLVRARRIVCDAETGVQQLKERYGRAKRVFRLGVLSAFLDDVVAPAARELARSAPKVRLAPFELTPREALDRLRAGELDAVLSGNVDAAERELFVVRRLVRHPLAAVLPAEHRLAAARTISLAELADDPFVSLSDAFFPGRRAFLVATCEAAGFTPEIAHEVDSLGLCFAAVAAGDGVALSPHHSRKLPHAGCVFVALAPPVPQAELFLVRPRGAAGDECARLEQALAAHAARLG